MPNLNSLNFPLICSSLWILPFVAGVGYLSPGINVFMRLQCFNHLRKIKMDIHAQCVRTKAVFDICWVLEKFNLCVLDYENDSEFFCRPVDSTSSRWIFTFISMLNGFSIWFLVAYLRTLTLTHTLQASPLGFPSSNKFLLRFRAQSLYLGLVSG